MRWRYLDTGVNSGDYNMALDAAIARGGFCPVPTLRVFRWRPFCISLGYHQNADEILLWKCQEASIDVARRPTAGRAILHAEELTYSVMIPAGHSLYEMLPLDFYHRISEALATGLQRLGAQVRFAPGEKLSLNGKPLRMACFASAARNEILAQGKKVVGSAQRRFREGTLQHGSILLGSEHERLLEFLCGDTEALSIERERLQERTTTMQHACAREVSFVEAAEAVRTGFEESLGVQFDEREALPEETNLAETWRPQYRVLQTNYSEEKPCESLASV